MRSWASVARLIVPPQGSVNERRRGASAAPPWPAYDRVGPARRTTVLSPSAVRDPSEPARAYYRLRLRSTSISIHFHNYWQIAGTAFAAVLCQGFVVVLGHEKNLTTSSPPATIVLVSWCDCSRPTLRTPSWTARGRNIGSWGACGFVFAAAYLAGDSISLD